MLLQHAIDSIASTFYTQVMFADFELQAHRLVEQDQPVTADTLNGIYASLLRDYYGDVIDDEAISRVTWARIPHFFSTPYYVYQYATCFASTARLMQDIRAADAAAARDGVERYLSLLRAGGSDYPMKLLARAGVDLSQPDTVRAVTVELDMLVGRLEAELAAALGCWLAGERPWSVQVARVRSGLQPGLDDRPACRIVSFHPDIRIERDGRLPSTLMNAPILDHMSALSDQTRCRMLLLLERHELTVSELCAVLQMPQSSVSRHLKTLADDDWVASRRDGTSRFYSMPADDLDSGATRLWPLIREQVAATSAAGQDDRRLKGVLARRRAKSQEFFANAAAGWDRLRQRSLRRHVLPVGRARPDRSRRCWSAISGAARDS